MAVYNLIKKIKETGLTEYHKGSDQPVTATTGENASIFEELVCSQDNEPGTHQTNHTLDINQQIISSLLGQEKESHCYKRLKTPQMNSACHKRRAKCAGKFLQHFSIHSLRRLVFQDEKDFSLQVPANRQNNEFVSMVTRKMFNWNACTVKETTFQKRLWYLL